MNLRYIKYEIDCDNSIISDIGNKISNNML